MVCVYRLCTPDPLPSKGFINALAPHQRPQNADPLKEGTQEEPQWKPGDETRRELHPHTPPPQPKLFLAELGWLPVCIPYSALKGLPTKMTRHSGFPAHTRPMPAVLASLFVEFPFCQSHKNSILDDKLNGSYSWTFVATPAFFSWTSSFLKFKLLNKVHGKKYVPNSATTFWFSAANDFQAYSLPF